MARFVYLYRPDHPRANERGFVEASEAGDLSPVDAKLPVFTDRYMEGDRAPDGTPIDNRQRRKAWMQATGSADFNDFTETRAKAAKAREAVYTTGGDHKERREQIGRALYAVRNGRKS